MSDSKVLTEVMEVSRSLEFSGGYWSCREGIGVVWKRWVERGVKLIGVVRKGVMEFSFPRVAWRIGAVLDLYHPVFPGTCHSHRIFYV